MPSVQCQKNAHAFDRPRKKDPPAKGLASLKYLQQMKHVSVVAESESKDSDSDESYHPHDSSGTSSRDSDLDTDNIAEEAGSDINLDVWSSPVQKMKMASVKLCLMQGMNQSIS